MDVKAFHGMDVEELVAQMHELKQELFHLRCQLALGRIENPMKIRQTRKKRGQSQDRSSRKNNPLNVQKSSFRYGE